MSVNSGYPNGGGLKYLITFGEPDDKTAEAIGYWPSGINSERVGKGNPQMAEASESGWTGDVEVRRAETRNFIKALVQAGVPTIELPYPDHEVMIEGGLTYDLEFLRDQVVSRPDGSVLLFPMGTPHRMPEKPFVESVYGAMGFKIEHLNIPHEGGNIVRLFMPDGTMWAFSGTSSRTSYRALQAGFKFMAPDTGRENQTSIGVRKGRALHVDCIFKPLVATVDDKELVTFLAYLEGFSRNSRQRMERAAHYLKAEIIEVSADDAARLVTNGVLHDGHLINPAILSDQKKQALLESRLRGFTHVPSSQTATVGGAFHCLTQELWYPHPIDQKDMNERLMSTGYFTGRTPVKIHNNY